MSELIVKLPKTCDRCHYLSGKIIAEQVVCCECGAPRMPVSAKTRNMIERVSQMYGAPAWIVFRTSDARDQIEKQDLLLSNKYGSDGRSLYQVITDTMTGGDEAPIDVGAVEDVTELLPHRKEYPPMPNVSELYPSKYLSASDLKGKRVIATIAKVTIEEFINDGDKQNKPVVHFKEAIKPFIANKTNVNIMAKLIGDNTDDWTGKQIGLRMDLVSFKGKVTESIRVTQTDEFQDSRGF